MELCEFAVSLYPVFHAVHFTVHHHETQVPNALKKAGWGCFSVSFGIKPFTHHLWAWHRGRHPMAPTISAGVEPSGTGGTKAGPT